MNEFKYSADARFTIRSISKEEYEQYVKFIPLYYQHIQKSTYTFLPKILGLYSMHHPSLVINRYYIIERNLLHNPHIAHKIKLWKHSSKLPNSINLGYLKKAQLMEQFEKDIVVSKTITL